MTQPSRKSIFMVAGEASGDLHGASLIQALLKKDPSLRIYGVGGEAMKQAGMEILFHSSELAVTGFFEVIFKFRKILSIFSSIVKHLKKSSPDVVILIDYPDFNLRLAKKLHRLSIPIFYYISPQVWAWRRYRVYSIRKWINRMFVVFPFEVDFYKKYGVEVDFVGHPLLEVVHTTVIPRPDPRKTIGLLPGSRHNEIQYLLKPMLEAARLMYDRYPQVQFLLPVAPTLKAEDMAVEVKKYNVPIDIVTGSSLYDVVSRCDVVVSCSGTATLETAILGKPMVIIYKLSALSYYLGRLIIRHLEFFGMPNIILGKKVVPELLQSEVTGENIASQVFRYLGDPVLCEKTSQELLQVKTKLGERGASQRVAEKILKELDNSSVSRGIDGYPSLFRLLHYISSPLLWLASLGYGVGVHLRHALYRLGIFRRKKVPAKVISIGNITVGGTGKTPLTLYLGKALQERGKKVVILSRGYKRRSKKSWDCVSDGEKVHLSAQEAGDEPYLMASKLEGIPIYVGAKRLQSAQEALKRHAVDVFLLDDGFQHTKLHRDFDFVTIDATSFKYSAHLLPYGLFREPLSYLKRADCLILTRTHQINPIQKENIKKRLKYFNPSAPILEANYRPVGLKHMVSQDSLPIEALSGKKVFAFAGIGNPTSFQKVIRDLKADVVGFKRYLDHRAYTIKDIERILAKAQEKKADLILTTEKDAVRILGFIPTSVILSKAKNLPLYSLSVDLQFTSPHQIADVLNAI